MSSAWFLKLRPVPRTKRPCQTERTRRPSGGTSIAVPGAAFSDSETIRAYQDVSGGADVYHVLDLPELASTLFTAMDAVMRFRIYRDISQSTNNDTAYLHGIRWRIVRDALGSRTATAK